MDFEGRVIHRVGGTTPGRGNSCAKTKREERACLEGENHFNMKQHQDEETPIKARVSITPITMPSYLLLPG